MPKRKEREKLSTYNNYDGTIGRQIVYFAISKMPSNWIINIDTEQMDNTLTPTQLKMLKYKFV